MGQRGPTATPSAVLAARGSKRANLNPNEPKPAPVAPRRPKGFSQDERRVWNRLVGTLADMRVLAAADWAAMERYVRSLVQYRENERFLDAMAKKHGATVPRGSYPVFTDDPASYIAGPLPGGLYLKGYREYAKVGEQKALKKELKETEDRFGLTPAARTRIWATSGAEPHLHQADDGPDPETYFFAPRPVG